jgi:ketosteroid isomerase-like protein
MKKLLILIMMITLSSCTGVQQNPDFDKNVELAKTWFDTFTSEDYDATAALMSEDVEWQGCFYGSPVMNKEEAMAYMKGWHDAMENITYTPENYLPGVDPETGQLNGSVRTYGVWTGTNTASRKNFEILMYHYFTFNDEGKIINSGDFGDATGLIMAVAPDSAE